MIRLISLIVLLLVIAPLSCLELSAIQKVDIPDSTSVKVTKNILDDFQPQDDVLYIIRLKNGDIISGYYVEMVNDPKDGQGVKISTEIGRAVIFGKQIAEIDTKDEHYAHSHRIFLLPTAEPIGKDHFVGSFELLFLYAGFGISDWFSMTAGRSVVPGLSWKEQASELNMKFTVYKMQFLTYPSTLSIAVGGNLAFINHNNRLVHFYAVGTIKGQKSIVTASLFYKGGSGGYYTLRARQNEIGMIYEDGAIGLGVGLDTKFTSWDGLHFIGELWNTNLEKPTNSAVLLGFRLCSTEFAADFGLSFFTQPFVAPFVSFVWTPF